MTPARVRRILQQVADGGLDTDAAFAELQSLPFEDLGFAKVDLQREARSGFPEVIFGPGKTAPQIAAIARRLAVGGQNVLITRLEPGTASLVLQECPELAYEPHARIASWRQTPVEPRGGTVLVVAAGTSDIPVAEEAALTAEMLGNPVGRIYDVGVAGIHRLFAHTDRLRSARVVIVVAGMEGALPSVVGGLIDKPLIAVPTSIGYGASFGGLAALLAMLNSCAAGVTVVNIDNGFGAAVAATLINRA